MISAKKFGIILGVILILFPAGTECWAYNLSEHSAMNEWILDNSVGGFDFDKYARQNLGLDLGINDKNLEYLQYFYFLTIGEYKSPRDLIAQGGRDEDSPFLRCTFHFHNPTQSWDQGGYNNFGIRGDSSILWAQKGLGEQSEYSGGNYSWYDARDYFYNALIGSDDDQRSRYMANALLAVGHLMHLIQDSSCPEHVRNDSHAVNKSVYENLLKYYHLDGDKDQHDKFTSWLQSSQNHPYPFTLSALDADLLPANAQIPIALMVDTDWFFGNNPDKTMDPLIGLAEYTHVNFLSQGRIFEVFNYPNLSSVTKEVYSVPDPENEGSFINREYLKKTGDGDTGYKLSTTSITGNHVIDPTDPVKTYRVSALDNNVLEDYAERLVPRAVTYSEKLLEYFFRGDIEISLPSNGVYAFRDKEPDDPSSPIDPRIQGFNKVNLLVKNKTKNGELMSGGTIDLVIRYRFLTNSSNSSDPAYDAKDPLLNESYSDLSQLYVSKPQYIVKSYSGPADTEIIKPGTATLLEFDLGSDEIPLWAADVRFYIVYRGKLGVEGEYVEQDAVCVGYKDVSEPTELDFSNSVDLFCYDEAWWYDLDSPANLQALKDRFESNSCIQYMTVPDLLNLEIKFAAKGATPGTTPYYTISKIGPGQYKRVYVITDYDATLYYHSNSLASPSKSIGNIGMRNGAMAVNGMRAWSYPTFTTYRGLERWSGCNLVQSCASCIEGYDCTECDPTTISESEDLAPVRAEATP